MTHQPDPTLLLDGIPDAIASYDRDWHFLYVNPKMCEMLRRTPEEVLGHSLWESFPLLDGTRLQHEFLRAIDEQRAIVFDELREHSGRWHEHRLFPSPRGLTVWSRDVTDRRHAELTHQTLLEMARDVAETEDPDELLGKAHARTRTALGCDAVVTFRFDDTTGMFRVARRDGGPPEHAAELAALTFRPFEPFGGRLATGPVVVTRDSAPEPVALLLAHFGWHTLLVVPLRRRDRQLGAFATMFRDPARKVGDWQRELCTGIAHQLAAALEQAETHRTEQDDAAVSAALARLGHRLLSSFDHARLLDQVCALTAEALGCALCATFLWSAEDEAFVPIGTYGFPPTAVEEMRPLGVAPAAIPNLLRRLVEEGVFVQSDFAQEERRAMPSRMRPPEGTVMLFTALRRGEQVIGFQVAAQATLRRPFSALQLRIARGAVQLISMAIEHGHVLDQLERANRLKSEFVAMMSHELRTPLHVMLGYGDLLLDGAFGPLDAPVVDALHRMRRSSKDLLELVREMLDLNRLETGRMPVHLEEVVPAEVLAEVATYSADLQIAPDVVLRTSCAAELAPITTDRAKVVTILRNLIGNAVKFTREGVIEASVAAADDDGICLTVRDTGAGIAAVLLPHIFEPFRQGDASSGGLRSGVGLGLYIVRRMVDALGGQLAVDSTPGRGSTFRVTIPDGRRPLLDERDRLRAMLATTGGAAAVVDAAGTIVAVNDRWLRTADERGGGATDRLGVGANYFAVCARACGSEADVAAAASRGLRDVIDGRREHFTLDYVLAAPSGPEPHRMQVSALVGAARHALVSHLVIVPAAPTTGS